MAIARVKRSALAARRRDPQRLSDRSFDRFREYPRRPFAAGKVEYALRLARSAGKVVRQA